MGLCLYSPDENVPPIATLHECCRFACMETIKPYVDEFIRFAKENTHLTFLVTRIGCGIAGFRDEEIAPLFKEAPNLENVVLPKEFVECLEDCSKNHGVFSSVDESANSVF